MLTCMYIFHVYAGDLDRTMAFQVPKIYLRRFCYHLFLVSVTI